MLTLKIIGADGAIKAEHKGMDIKAVYNGTLAEGDAIKVSLDGCDHIAVKLDETLAESIVWVPNKSFEFKIPSPHQLKMGYHPSAFKGDTHVITVREPEDEEIYAYRNIALNSHDKHGNVKYFPHASANFVTREDPCFYERNAIDGVMNNQGHGAYPYHSWAGGARNDLEFFLDFKQERFL